MVQLLAGVAIINKNKVLLLKNVGSGDQDGKWGPPSGHGETGETTEETAIRETKEEANLDVKLKGVIQIGYFNYKEKDYIYVFYLAEAKDLKALKIQNEEVSDYAWASLEDLKKGRYVFRKKFLREPVIIALTQKPSKNNLFKIYKVE